MRRLALEDDDRFDESRSRYRAVDEDDDDRRPTKGDRPHSSPGLFWRLFRWVRFLIFMLPLTVLLVGSFLVDCRNRSGNSFLPDFVRVSACAREDLTNRFSSLEDTMRVVTRAIR